MKVLDTLPTTSSVNKCLHTFLFINLSPFLVIEHAIFLLPVVLHEISQNYYYYTCMVVRIWPRPVELWAGPLGRVGVAGSVHPMLTVTHTSYSCHEVLEKKSTDSSPSHSQVSRNSSRKSNNSLLVNNGKLEGEARSSEVFFFRSFFFF